MNVSGKEKNNACIHIPRVRRCERKFTQLPVSISGIDIPMLSEEEIQNDLSLAQHMKGLNDIDLTGDHLCCVLVSESEEVGMLAAAYLAARHGGVSETDYLEIHPSEEWEEDEGFEESISLEDMLPIYDIKPRMVRNPVFIDSDFSDSLRIQRKGKTLRLPHWVDVETSHPLLILTDEWGISRIGDIQKQTEMRSLTIVLVVMANKGVGGLEEIAMENTNQNVIQEIWFSCAADVLQISNPAPDSLYTRTVFQQMLEENGLALRNPSQTGALLRQLETFRRHKGGASNENLFRYARLLNKMYVKQESEETVLLSRTQAVKPLQKNVSRRKAMPTEQDPLCGCESVKRQLRAVVDLMHLQNERRQRRLPAPSHGQVLLFAGAPGTGKSTAARMLYDWMSQRELICGTEWGEEFFQISGAQLKARYVGHTAPMIHELFENHPFLFIDEAYALAESGEEGANNDHFAQEAMGQLCLELENLAPNRVVVFAGYGGQKNNRMRAFLNANPGLASRITATIQFDSYDPEKELPAIFAMQAERMELKLPRTWREMVIPYFRRRAQEMDYGSGREARRLLECCLGSQARRLSAHRGCKVEDLCRLREEDIQAAIEDLERGFRALEEEKAGRVGLLLT